MLGIGTVAPTLGAESPWLVAARRCAAVVFLGVVPACLLAFLVVDMGHHESDFTTFWQSGRDVLHGRSPYPLLDGLPRHVGPASFAPFVYPPLAAVAMIPLSVLPYHVALFLFIVVDLAAVALALRLLGVDDWRCYGAAYVSAPVYSATGLGAISPLLLLGVAALWRFRNRALVAGALVAGVATAKLFLWPLWLWLVRTRRYAAAGVAVVVSVVAVACAWAAIGFAGVREYPTLLGRLTSLVGPESYSPYALGRSLGLGGGTAQAVAYAVALVAIAAAAWTMSDSGRLLTAALAVSLVATPILWPHYLVLLFVPIAIARRSFSPLWLLPLAFWLDSTAWSMGSTTRIAGLLAIATATLATCAVLTPRRLSDTRARRARAGGPRSRVAGAAS
jgi:Glycosyltransferase family 87